MKYNNILEAVTSQGFTFGFELECITPDGFVFDEVETLVGLSPEQDSSIKVPENLKGKYFGIELVSEPLTLNPQTIISVKKTIVNLFKAGVKTNDSCGFHIHYSYSRMSYIDICWLLLNMSCNGDMSLFSEFEGIQFFDKQYASKDFIEDIKYQIEEGQPVEKIFTTNKYQLIRIHPQGTLEWRGPRNFMNNGSLDLIDKFFIRLYRCADSISKLISNTKVSTGSITISKNDFYKKLSNPSSSISTDMKKTNGSKDKRFAYNQDAKNIENAFKVRPELSKCKFSNILISVDNSGTLKLSGGEWSEGTISNAVFDNVVIRNGNMSSCKIIGKTLANSKVEKVTLTNVNMTRVDIEGSDMTNCTGMMCDIKNTNVNDSYISSSKLSNCKIDSKSEVDPSGNKIS